MVLFLQVSQSHVSKKSDGRVHAPGVPITSQQQPPQGTSNPDSPPAVTGEEPSEQEAVLPEEGERVVPGRRRMIDAGRPTLSSHNVQLRQIMKDSLEHSKQHVEFLKQKEANQNKYRESLLQELKCFNDGLKKKMPWKKKGKYIRERELKQAVIVIMRSLSYTTYITS